jgi:hypothetical protein
VHDRARTRRGALVRRTAAACCAALLLLSTAACTGDEEPAPSAAEESVRPSEQGTATLEPRPAAARVRVTRLAGRMRARDQEVLADNVGKVVTRYFQDAYLAGPHPRESFDDAFATFTEQAAARAGRARDLLTNERLAPTTESVVPRRQTAYLSVLAPNRVAAGVTAKVQLDYLAERGDRPDQLVRVKGRLLLTRAADGGWKIFGYDLTRSVSTAGEGS